MQRQQGWSGHSVRPPIIGILFIQADINLTTQDLNVLIEGALVGDRQEREALRYEGNCWFPHFVRRHNNARSR
jgi:hypothetical protein